LLGRVDVEADDVFELGRELGIARALEGADAMRLEVVGLPATGSQGRPPVVAPERRALHRAQRDPRRLGHGAAGPVGRLAQRLGAGQRHHPLHGLIAERRFAGLAGGVAQQPVDPGLGEALLPAPHGRPADPGAFGHRCDVQSIGRAEDDPSPCHMLLGPVAIADDRLETSTILSRDERTHGLSHRGSMPRPCELVNPLNVSVL
jgi:hypothetical protein